MVQTQTTVDEFHQTFWIHTDNGAYINGYLDDGEVFYITVPKEFRRQGIAKQLLRLAENLLREYGHSELKFTSATTEEGAKLVKWYKKN